MSVALSGAAALTLMACYGMPPCESEEDNDGDGSMTCEDGVDLDCDDSDPNIHPGADDPVGDDIDQNCDGVDGIRGEGGAGGGGSSAGGQNAGGGGANAGGGGQSAGGANVGGAGGGGGN